MALELPIYLHYEDTGPEHRLLQKRDVGDDDSNGDFDGEGFTLPSDVEVQEESVSWLAILDILNSLYQGSSNFPE